MGNLAGLTELDGDYAKALELEDRCLDLIEAALKRIPQAPNLLRERGVDYTEKADLLTRLKRPEEATKCYQEAIASYRTAAKENPLVSRYQEALANALRSQAARLAARHQYPEARALYEESCEILEALTRRVDDRPIYGAALIAGLEKLAEFYEWANGDTSDEVARQRARLRYLEQAVQIGRRLSKKFPDDRELHFRFAEVLFQRALFNSEAGRNKEAFPLYQECVEILRTRAWSAGYQPTDYESRRMFVWMGYAQQCAGALKRSDEVMQLADLAHDLGKGCTNREVIDSLGTLIDGSAFVHNEAGRNKEAIEQYNRALRIRKPELEKFPWHWYLRNHVSLDYKNLAQCYEKMGDSRGEVQAWREYLKTWSGPMHGMKIADYVDPARPADQAEAVRLRQFVKSEPGVRVLSTSYDLAGRSHRLVLHLTNVPWPKDPLEDQARWLKEAYGGTIPEDVRESVRKLHKIAYERNVGFVKLLENNAAIRSFWDSRKEELNETKKRLLADILARTDLLKKAPSSAVSQLALGKDYEDLAGTHEGLGEQKEAVADREQARQIYEAMHR